MTLHEQAVEAMAKASFEGDVKNLADNSRVNLQALLSLIKDNESVKEVIAKAIWQMCWYNTDSPIGPANPGRPYWSDWEVSKDTFYEYIAETALSALDRDWETLLSPTHCL